MQMKKKYWLAKNPYSSTLQPWILFDREPDLVQEDRLFGERRKKVTVWRVAKNPFSPKDRVFGDYGVSLLPVFVSNFFQSMDVDPVACLSRPILFELNTDIQVTKVTTREEIENGEVFDTEITPSLLLTLSDSCMRELREEIFKQTDQSKGPLDPPSNLALTHVAPILLGILDVLEKIIAAIRKS
jgi:hypothetical protein